MTIPDLGKLVEVELRMAWNHEAHSFTPWLAEHLDQLADKIGIPLELEGREVRVDAFSADILRTNPRDESLVLIENQLEQSDHLHLGQILTYLAGLEAKTIIWIAKNFRDAHKSAIDWLNDNTSDEFAFFAVQVKAVQIANSPIAPIFDVVSRPNYWECALHQVANTKSDRSHIYEKRVEFWKHYTSMFPEELKYCSASGASHRWRRLEPVEISIITYLAANCVGIYVRGMKGSDRSKVFENLKAHEAELAQHFESELGVESDKYLFVSELRADTDDRSTWNELCSWLKCKADHYDATLRRVFDLADDEE